MERTGRERRSFPRPPLWLNLLLLVIAATTFAYAKHPRNVVLEKTTALFRNENSPAELRRMRDELAQMDLSKEQLSKQLDGRMQCLQSMQGGDFYISINIARQTMHFRFG